MRLAERMERQGTVLFRWRSFMPLVLVPLFLLALRDGRGVSDPAAALTQDGWSIACLAISFAGQVLRWATVGFVPPGTSGRNTRWQRADSLNTTGMYSIVRHPLYLGNFITQLGIALLTMCWWFVLVFLLAYALYIERVIATEEAFLARRFGWLYLDWAAVTPTFLPRPDLWRRPDRPFSFRAVLRREYNGVLAVASAFIAIEFAAAVAFGTIAPDQWLAEGWGWVALFLAAGLLFLTLRTLKHRTSLLDVAPTAPTK